MPVIEGGAPALLPSLGTGPAGLARSTGDAEDERARTVVSLTQLCRRQTEVLHQVLKPVMTQYSQGDEFSLEF
jgi:hypothetical protein